MTHGECPHCSGVYIESEDSFCRVCGQDCCESCLEAQACPACVAEHHAAFTANEHWRSLSDRQRRDAIRQAM